jgi:hypothetical protein
MRGIPTRAYLTLFKRKHISIKYIIKDLVERKHLGKKHLP